jgi:integrase
VARVCERAKVQNLHLHDLRGEFASRLAESKVPMHQVRDALGHANLSMTSAYLRTRTDSLDEAYAQLDRHEARKRLKLVKAIGPRLAHDDEKIAAGWSS